MMKYRDEISKLARYLADYGAEFEFRHIHDGYQICVPNKANCVWDVVCHSYSYGSQYGLLEGMGELFGDEDDDVEGYLTADEIIKRLLNE